MQYIGYKGHIATLKLVISVFLKKKKTSSQTTFKSKINSLKRNFWKNTEKKNLIKNSFFSRIKNIVWKKKQFFSNTTRNWRHTSLSFCTVTLRNLSLSSFICFTSFTLCCFFSLMSLRRAVTFFSACSFSLSTLFFSSTCRCNLLMVDSSSCTLLRRCSDILKTNVRKRIQMTTSVK